MSDPLRRDAAERIRASYMAIAPRIEDVVATFYADLFEAYPTVRGLFGNDMTLQTKHLGATLALICRNATDLDILREPLMRLGAQHVGYGAKPEHYPAVRDALLGAIEKHSGSAWTRELRTDWLNALNAIAAIMLEGAAERAREAAEALSKPASDRPEIGVKKSPRSAQNR